MQTDIHLPEDFKNLIADFTDSNDTIFTALNQQIADNFTTISTLEKSIAQVSDVTYLLLNQMAVLIAAKHGVMKGQLRQTPRGKLRIVQICFDNDKMHDGIRIEFEDDKLSGISLTTVLKDTTLITP